MRNSVITLFLLLLGIHAYAGTPSLDLTLPSIMLTGKQEPKQLFDQTLSNTKKDTLTIIPAVDKREKFSINLTQAIALALRHNSTIKTTYMTRISQRYEYYLERRNRRLWYLPQNQPNISASTGRTINKSSSDDNANIIDSTNNTTSSNSYSIEPKFGFTSPIGTSINFDGQVNNDDGRTYTAGITVTQPLLKGFGYAINEIPWQQAQLTEKQNIISLREQVSSTILQVIQQYRQLIQASLTYENDKQALEEAQETLKNNEAQVKAGRLAKTQLLSGQIQVETTKNQLVSSLNDEKQQQRSFASLLGLDKNIDFKLDQNIEIPAVTLNEKKLIDLALENKPDYLQSLLSYQSNLLDLKEQKNNLLWDLSLSAGARKSRTPSSNSKTEDYNLGLSLSIPLDNTEQRKAVLDAKIAVENDQINLRQSKINIIAEVNNKITTLEQTYQALKIQTKQLALQELQVKNTELSLKYGRASSYDLAQQQQELNNSRNSLVSSKINYLNQLSELDDYLGTALATWQVVLAK